MSTYKLTLQYKGTHYQGFQIQSSGKTIQGEINRALEILAKSNQIKSIGSGRTDTGVHALAQVMRVDIPVDIPEIGLVKGLNSQLPADIRVMKAEYCGREFHPIFSSISKEYNYVFATTEYLSPFATELMTHFPYELNIDLMREGCTLFCGEHDFINYQCTGTEVDTTVRKIFSCQIEKHNSTGHWAHLAQEYYVLSICGEGFLKQMVRLIMGALWSLGKEKITLSDLKKSLEGPIKNRLGATAPPEGLYLKSVEY